MNEESLIDEFGKQPRIKMNYGELIDQDKLAGNDYYHFKLGYKLGIKTEKERIIKAIRESEYKYLDDYLNMLFGKENY